MAKRLIIHVGYPKTATTTIQNSIFKKCKSIKYLNENVKINRFLVNIPIENGVFERELDEFKKNLEEIVVGNHEETFVISNEQFLFSDAFRVDSKKFNYHIVPNRLKEALLDTGIFDEYSILIGIRNQIDLHHSMHTQTAKEISTKAYTDSIFDDKYVHYVELFDFNQIHRLYSEYFDNIRFYIFEELKPDLAGFSKNFGTIFNINSEVIEELLKESHYNKREKNGQSYVVKSVSPYIFFMHKVKNIFFKKIKLSDYKIGRMFINKSIVDKKVNFFTDKQADKIREYYHKSNRALMINLPDLVKHKEYFSRDRNEKIC